MEAQSKPLAQNTALWHTRAVAYDNLQWAQHTGYLQQFLNAGRFSAADRVLDVGTGTGIIPAALADCCGDITAIDSSDDMLERARAKGVKNTTFIAADLRELPFPDNKFTRVTARMVLHHVLTGLDAALTECHRVLEPCGLIVVSEGVPPHRRVQERYEEIFRLKEDRRTFFAEDLVSFVEAAGFGNIQTDVYVERQVSILNWLRSSGLPIEVQSEIFRLHVEADGFFKSVYNMTITEDDCLIDMKFVTVTAEKL